MRKKKEFRFKYKIIYSSRFSQDYDNNMKDIKELMKNRFRRDITINAFVYRNVNDESWELYSIWSAKPNLIRQDEITLVRENYKNN